jgi:pimeloyl-ACP methyl ester carboxylesterase
MASTANSETLKAKTQFVTVKDTTYAYRQVGPTDGIPLVCLQHFTGTLDNWDPYLIDLLAQKRPVILFESAGVGRSTGMVSNSISDMAEHVIAFLNARGISQADLLGYSMGGMVAQQLALDTPSLVRRMILAGTGPEGGENMNMDKPELLKIFLDPELPGLKKLTKLFFPASKTSQEAGEKFISRLASRSADCDMDSGMPIMQAHMAAIAAWGNVDGQRFAKLKRISQPCLIVNGNDDIVIPTINSYLLSQHLPDSVLLIYPDSGHGALFQYADSFARIVGEFLDTNSKTSVF